MDNNIYAFIFSSLAGLSTIIGSLLIFIKFKNINKLLSFILAFASSVMLFLSIFDLFFESINYLDDYFYLFPCVLISLIIILLGILFSFLLEKLIPSDTDSLYKLGIISMFAIIIHNIPEGIATFISTSNDISMGIRISIAIALHNIPEGISIALPIYYSTKNKSKALLYTFISGISEPFGALLAYLFLMPFINNLMLGIIFSIICGIMLYISLFELLPKSISYKYKQYTFIGYIIGLIIVIMNIFILK